MPITENRQDRRPLENDVAGEDNASGMYQTTDLELMPDGEPLELAFTPEEIANASGGKPTADLIPDEIQSGTTGAARNTLRETGVVIGPPPAQTALWTGARRPDALPVAATRRLLRKTPDGEFDATRAVESSPAPRTSKIRNFSEADLAMLERYSADIETLVRTDSACALFPNLLEGLFTPTEIDAYLNNGGIQKALAVIGMILKMMDFGTIQEIYRRIEKARTGAATARAYDTFFSVSHFGVNAEPATAAAILKSRLKTNLHPSHKNTSSIMQAIIEGDNAIRIPEAAPRNAITTEIPQLSATSFQDTQAALQEVINGYKGRKRLTAQVVETPLHLALQMAITRAHMPQGACRPIATITSATVDTQSAGIRNIVVYSAPEQSVFLQPGLMDPMRKEPRSAFTDTRYSGLCLVQSLDAAA